MATKKKPFVAHPEANHCPSPRGVLIAIGGHEDKTRLHGREGDNQDMATNSILRRFVEEINGRGPVVVVPIASTIPEEAAQDYLDVFRDLGVKQVDVLNVGRRTEVDTPQHLQLIEEAAGIMFTGGDQLRLTALLGGTELLRRLQERYTYDELIIAGTSAGAAAMSTPMVYQGRDDAGILKGEIHITTGLQFLHDVAIDTHFVARGRIVRMAQIIATNPGCIGVGLEEDTGVVVRNGCELEVIGSGIVVIVDGTETTYTNIHEIEPDQPFTIRDLRVHMLSCGERYTLPIHMQTHI